MEKVNINHKFSLFTDHWHPRVIAELNGQQVKAAKLKGEFMFHYHEHEDEMFLVIKGSLKMEFREKTVVINEGEFIVVPKGVEHKPIADEEVHLLLFEPSTTSHTGNIENERTKHVLDKI